MNILLHIWGPLKELKLNIRRMVFGIRRIEMGEKAFVNIYVLIF